MPGRRQLLIGRELVLPLGIQLELQLGDLLLESLVFFEQLAVGVTLAVELPLEHPQKLVAVARRTHERSQGGPAKMRAMTHMRATVLMIGIEGNLHRYPFLMPINLTPNRPLHLDQFPAKYGLGAKLLLWIATWDARQDAP